MIINTEIEIIRSTKDWTAFRYVAYDDVSKDDTDKIIRLMNNNRLTVSNPRKLANHSES
ncbi:MAG: hypothetical protein AAFQ02_09350 [Bacteroidota bacterium]